VSSAGHATPGELVFTDEQLTLLGDAAGRPGFPGATRPQLDEAGWIAVAQGLAARGVIHDDDPSADVRLADAVLSVVLHADAWLWVTVSDGEDEELSGQEMLWLSRDLRVRQSVTSNGFHRFSTGDVGELLDEVFGLLPATDSPPGPSHTLTEGELERLFADAPRMIQLDAGRRTGEARIDAELLCLIDSPALGLCVLDEDDGQAAAIHPIGVADARARISALAASIG
jgi:hypothetical protein